MVGAVLIKNYASLDKNEKSSMCFFLKTLPIKVLQKFCTYSMDSKEPTLREQRTEERTKTFQSPPPLLILSNSFFIKIIAKLTPAG
jgi:hypothetical protein